MATTGYVADLLRTYIDEPDQTFVDTDRLVKFLQVGYQEFRYQVMQVDPNIFATTASYDLTNATQIDLEATNPTGAATPIMGSTGVAGSQLEMLVSVYKQDTTGAIPTLIYNQTQSLEGMQSTDASFFFTDHLIMFPYRVSGTIKVVYVPSSNVDWTAAAGFIDNLSLFHDLIALYSYKQYAIMDAAENGPLISQLNKREQEMRYYLNSRSTGGANYVQDVSSNRYWT
tara:strand:- start:104 stop:787 length:684 start_codon:yes stop_codon:yes gene_type:complete